MLSRFTDVIRRSFHEFLGTPTLVIGGFIALSAIVLWLDRTDLPVFDDVSAAMSRLFFTDAASTRSLLGTLAGSMVTLTSITFSLLLIALQQAAASMTHSIVDQFLRRRSNQIFFGFFVGLALYALIVLSATAPSFNPILSASVALFFAAASLFLLIVLIYSTIHQMRPAVVVEAIHDLTLSARERQQGILARTRRTARRADSALSVTTDEEGFVVNVDIDALGGVLQDRADAEIEIRAPIGAYVAHGEPLADVRGLALDDGARTAIRAAFATDRVRDVSTDAAFGVEELVNIAWTSISTSKQNPAPGRLVILSIRDLLARWAAEAAGDGSERGKEEADRLPIVYADSLFEDAIGALEELSVVCSESMQAQNAAAVVETFARIHPRLPPAAQDRVADVAMRTLAGLGDHVLTAALEKSLHRLVEALAVTHPAASMAVARAVDELARSNGSLNSRSTRVR